MVYPDTLFLVCIVVHIIGMNTDQVWECFSSGMYNMYKQCLQIIFKLYITQSLLTGYVCFWGFNWKTRELEPLSTRFHNQKKKNS